MESQKKYIENLKILGKKYDKSIEKYQWKINFTGLIAFISNALSGAINILKTVLITENISSKVILGLTIATIVLNLICLILTQLPKFKKWPDKLDIQKKYLFDINNFLSDLMIQHDNGDFSTQNLNIKYHEFLKSLPELDGEYVFESINV